MGKPSDDDKWNALYDFVSYYGSYLWLPAVVVLGVLYDRGAIGGYLLAVCLAVIAICFYGRFIEPRRLIVREHRFDLTPDGYDGPSTMLRAALFSDTHYGIFKNVMPLRRLREAIEAREVDIAIVAGDLTNHLMVHEIDETFEDFRKFPVPVVAVLGNHDYGKPGWLVSDFLARRLKAFGVTVLDNEAVTYNIEGQAVRVAGLMDHYSGPADYDLLGRYDEPGPHIVIAHNPDAVLHFPVGTNMGIMVSGHTHGGQIRIPRLYKKVIPTRYGFDAGYYETRGQKVFVTSGTGMDVLPVRLGIPPRLDILNLRIVKEAVGD